MGRAATGTARAIYGQILVLSIVAAYSEDDALDSWEVLVAVVATMLVFWAAHLYSEALARRMGMDRSLRVEEVMNVARGELPLVLAAVPSAVILALGGLGAFSLTTSIDLALAAGLAGLAIWGFEAGRRSDFGWVRTLAATALTCGLGALIVLLKILIH